MKQTQKKALMWKMMCAVFEGDGASTHLSAQVPGLFGHLIDGWIQGVSFLFPASL